ncbi:MAG: HAMP domain-containing histidine kinase [Clostridia bacterium]|nr:HAMP domain-containing histidine kinase [Clostridia bacterium]
MKFRTKILLAMVWILALAMGVGGALLVAPSFSDAIAREKNICREHYRMIVSAMELRVAAGSDENSAETWRDTMSRLEMAVDAAAWRLVRDGEVILQEGDVFPETMPEPGENQQVLQIFHTNAGKKAAYIGLSGGIRMGDERMVLTLVADVSDVYRERESMLSTFQWVFTVTLAVGAILSFLLAAALTRPLGKMSAAARKMAKGDLGSRIRTRSKDEVGTLARDFNHMADRLQSNVRAMEETVEAQERFMGSFAHELKTPMTSIIGYADLLRGQEMNARDAQEAANYIFTEGKRLESLSLKLLSLHLAKNETPDLEWVEVNRLVERTAKKMRPVLMQNGIRLECRTTPGKWRMDAALMESVLTNLLDNARKAMEKEGMVAMLLDFPEGDCRIRVIDNGRGMPPEVISHLTEAFYRVDKSRSRAQGGAGLGLSLCNEIVEYHGGELQFESIEGKGTCVSVILKEGAV